MRIALLCLVLACTSPLAGAQGFPDCNQNGIDDTTETISAPVIMATSQRYRRDQPISIPAAQLAATGIPGGASIEPDSVVVTGSQGGNFGGAQVGVPMPANGFVQFNPSYQGCGTSYLYYQVSDSCSQTAFGTFTIYVDPPLVDCNNNCLSDAYEISISSEFDCNANGRLDSCDIACGVSLDENGDSIPDECATTCLRFLDVLNQPERVHVSDAASLDLTTAMTVECWINRAVLANYAFVLGKWGDDQIQDRSYMLALTVDGDIEFRLSRTDTQQDMSFHDFRAGRIAAGEWHHVAGTYDGAKRRIYVDGVLVGEKATTGPIHVGTTDLAIGEHWNSNALGTTNEGFQGMVDEVRLWSVARTADQIRAMASRRITASNAAQHAGIVSVWAFEGSASDVVGTNHGTIVGHTGVGTQPFFPFYLTAATRPILFRGCPPANTSSSLAVASTNGGGTPGNAASSSPKVSRDGRFVAFSSLATTLVQPDTNNASDVFRRDLQSNAIARISVDNAGQAANMHCYLGDISSTGRYVVFSTYAGNLAAVDVNGALDVYVRDVDASSTALVSIGLGGVPSNGSPFAGDFVTSITSDGRYVSFSSDATNLVTPDTTVRDVFVRDLVSNTTIKASQTPSGVSGNGDSYSARLTPDGRFLVFCSVATNLLAVGANQIERIYVRNLQTGALTLGSSPLAEASFTPAFDPSISDDGRFVCFLSASTLIPSLEGGSYTDVFVRDVWSSVTTLVSATGYFDISTGGYSANAHSDRPYLSGDGRFVVFESFASNLAPPYTSGGTDVYLADRSQSTIEKLSKAPGGTPAFGTSTMGSLSGDGSVIVFTSTASNLVSPQVTGTQVYAMTRTKLAPQTFCGGTAALCPCANAGAPGSGCASSISAEGASLTFAGDASLSADSLVLMAAGTNSTAVTYFQGTAQAAAGAGTAFGDGLRCAAGTVIRLKSPVPVTGVSHYPDAGDASISVRGLVSTPGTTRYYQVNYRNAANFCTPATFNLTNGVSVPWGP